jgi:hypothetical protein
VDEESNGSKDGHAFVDWWGTGHTSGQTRKAAAARHHRARESGAAVDQIGRLRSLRMLHKAACDASTEGTTRNSSHCIIVPSWLTTATSIGDHRRHRLDDGDSGSRTPATTPWTSARPSDGATDAQSEQRRRPSSYPVTTRTWQIDPVNASPPRCQIRMPTLLRAPDNSVSGPDSRSTQLPMCASSGSTLRPGPAKPGRPPRAPGPASPSRPC